MPLRTAGYRWRPGHRIRVAVSSSLWPVLWPSPFPATFDRPSRHGHAVPPRAAGHPGRRRPGRRGRARPSGPTPPDLECAEGDPADGGGPARADPPVWRIDEDVLAGSTTVHVHDGGESIVPDGRRLYAAETLRMTAWDADPARAELVANVVYRWQEREAVADGELTAIEIRADSTQTSTATDFDLAVRLEVDVDGERFFERDWHEVHPAPPGLTPVGEAG